MTQHTQDAIHRFLEWQKRYLAEKDAYPRGEIELDAFIAGAQLTLKMVFEAIDEDCIADMKELDRIKKVFE